MQCAFDRSILLTLGFSTRGTEDYSLWCAEAGVATDNPAVHRMTPAVNAAPCHQHQGGESLSLIPLAAVGNIPLVALGGYFYN